MVRLWPHPKNVPPPARVFINIAASSLHLLEYLLFPWRHPTGRPGRINRNVLTFWQHRVHGCTCAFASVCTTGTYTCTCSTVCVRACVCVRVCCGNTGQTPGLARQSKWWISQVVEVYIALLSGCREEIQSPVGQLKEYLVTKYDPAVQLVSSLHLENTSQKRGREGSNFTFSTGSLGIFRFEIYCFVHRLRIVFPRHGVSSPIILIN